MTVLLCAECGEVEFHLLHQWSPGSSTPSGREAHEFFPPVKEGDEQKLPSLSIEDFQRVMEGYLNSAVCMSLFSALIFLRASGENPRVVVKRQGHSLRVSLHSSNGDVQHFNRDGKP